MSAHEDLALAQRRWAESARERLASLTEAVGVLRQAFELASEALEAPAADPSETVVAACTALSGWLAVSKAPRGLGMAEGELGAATGVYRNAAFAFRSVFEADDLARTTRIAACATMLEQGDDHVAAFTALTAKKADIGGAPRPS